MKKVIIIVGTSIFDNFFSENKSISARIHYKNLQGKKLQQLEAERQRFTRLKSMIDSWVEHMIKSERKSDISAEIKSISTLEKNDFKIYLLCPNSILAKLAGDTIKMILEDEYKVAEPEIIQDDKEFSASVSNLITKICEIADNEWNNVIIDITSAHKAIVPYLTILAQLNQCQVYHLLEETDELIKIPNIPLVTKQISCTELIQIFNKINNQK